LKWVLTSTCHPHSQWLARRMAWSGLCPVVIWRSQRLLGSFSASVYESSTVLVSFLQVL
jgi:hypothetical protein